MAERLIADTVYHPFGGMNIDANGITAKTNEAIDVVNCSVTAADVTARRGTKLLGGDTIVVDGLYPGQGNGNYIPYYQDPETGRATWVCETAENNYLSYRPDNEYPWILYYNVEGGYSEDLMVNTFPFPTPPAADWLDAYSFLPAPEIVLSGEYVASYTEPVIKYHKYTDPTSGLRAIAFTANGIYEYQDTVGWASLTDETFQVEQWSVTDIIDHKLGATIVAAGSTHTLPTQPYSDAQDRVLFYFNTDTAKFEPFEVHTNLYDSETYAVDIAGSSVNKRELTTPREIVSGTAYIVVEGATSLAGVIAVAVLEEVVLSLPLLGGGQEEVVVNRLQAVNELEVAVGDESYIRLDTGEISLKFWDDTYDGLNWNIVYEYKEPVTYRPLHVINYHNALIMSNTVEYFVTDLPTEGDGNWNYQPWRVRWSDQGDITVCRNGNYQDLALSDISPILAMRELETAASSTIKGPLYFYKHNSIIRGTYNQNYNLYKDAPVPMFQFDIAYSEGVEAVDTITNIDGRHIFLGRNDVYMFDGVNRMSLTHDRNTGGTRVQKYIFDRLELDSLYRAFGVYDEIDRKYYLYLTFNSASGEYPEDSMVYDLDNGTWSRNTHLPTSAALNTDAVSGIVIDALQGVTDNLEGTINTLAVPRQKSVLLCMNGYTFVESPNAVDGQGVFNQPFDSYFITRDFFGGSLENDDRVQRVHVEGKSGNISLSYSGTYDTAVSAFEFDDTLVFSSKYRRESYNPDVVTYSLRLKVKLETNAVFRWMQVFSVAQELTND